VALLLSHWRLLGFWVGGRCVARTRQAHLDARARIVHERLASSKTSVKY
jgi:hypothetical protein